MAEVMPAPITMARKLELSPCRFGRPKLMLEAPQVVLTFSSVRRRRIRWNTALPAWPSAPIGITSGSTTMSECGMP